MKSFVRLVVWCVTLAVLLLLASQWLLLNFDTFKLVGLHAPMWLSAVLGAVAILGLHIFARQPGRARVPYAVIALIALVLFGFSLRWVGSHITGNTQEYWAGVQVSDVDTRADDDFCYRMDGRTFDLRGMRFHSRFTYWRGIWPTAFSEAELKARFAPWAVPRGDGWNCPRPRPVRGPTPR